MSVDIGQKAPNFSLVADDGTRVSLNDFFGRDVVLYFYPRDDTSGCTQEAKDFKESFDSFTKLNTMLVRYASSLADSKGRKFHECESECRDCYQRDRDRVVHSYSFFRKLMFKTQVFINYEGDYYRTRLTHSLEVAQIARSISKKIECK